MDLWVVIPCHARWDLLPGALAAAAPWPVVVVDDAPPGAPRAHPPGATIVQTSGSEGFARAVNRGLAEAQRRGATHALLLNDDARPEPGCIEALAAAFGPEVGAAGPVLRRGDEVECAGFDVAGWGRVRVRRAVPAGPTDVAGLSGACLLIEAAERLDERFAHGFEDLDLCRRLSRAGRAARLVPAARCQHLGGATLARDSRRAQRHAVAGHLRLLGRRRYAPVVVALALGQVLREGGPLERASGVAEGLLDWARGR